MPITLADIRKLEGDKLTRGVLDTFLMENELSQYVPVQNIDTFEAAAFRAVSLPTVGTRQLGSSYSESKGSFDWIRETVYPLGGYVDVDYLAEMNKAAVKSPRAAQTELFSKSMAYKFNDYLINGLATAEAPDGINYRVSQLASRQTVDASGLDITSAGSTPSTLNTFFDYLDKAIYYCDGHKCDLILCNDNVKLLIDAGLRKLGLFAEDKDQFGRSITTYKGAKIIDVGVTSDQTTKIIPDNMDTNTSIFFVRLGEDYFSMLNFLPLTVRDLGRQDGTPNLRTEIEWVLGFMMPHPRGLVKLKNVKAA